MGVRERNDSSTKIGLIMQNEQRMNAILESFKIKAKCIKYQQTDNYFSYSLTLLPGAKVNDIKKYCDEISIALKATGKPNVKILHKQGIVKLEFCSERTSTLKLFDYFSVDENVPNGDLICLLGQDTSGEKVWMDLAKNPHMIVSGTTGSGKSVLLHNIIANLLNYSDCLILLVDPKNIEFANYQDNAIKNINVFNSYNETIDMVNKLVMTMEFRYEQMKSGVSNKNMPYIVCIIDEFADLIMQDTNNELHTKLCQLAQKCRAAKISIILATQRPSTDVINGTIKANFPARIACKVASHIDSKIILDMTGAENLMGYGDAMVKDIFRNLERFQVAYTNADEICNFFSQQ